jgi:type VI secretion system protein ImpA
VKFDTLSPLVEKMLAFAQGALARRDPSRAPAVEAAGSDAPTETPGGTAMFESLADVDGALASALGYFQAKEPSSPALLLVVQARATLGKNLYEVIRLLAPRHIDNARVFVGPSDAFSIPVKALEDAPALDFSRGDSAPAETRAQALALIEKVASHLRSAEPSSPAPYLLDRARALATRDFLSLLGEVFPTDDLESMGKGY